MRTVEARDGRARSGVARGSAAEQVGTPCIDGMSLTAADVERNAEKQALQQEVVRKAVYAVASHADDAQQCRGLFEMMGIDLASVRAAREAHAKP